MRRRRASDGHGPPPGSHRQPVWNRGRVVLHAVGSRHPSSVSYLDELFIYEKDELVDLWNRSKRAWFRTLGSLLQRIKSGRFDMAIDLSLGERYSFLLMLFGVPRRVGFDFRRRGRFLTHRFPMEGYQDQHVVEYYRQLLHMIGIRLVDAKLELRLNEQDRHGSEQRLMELCIPPDRPVIGLVPAGGVSWGIQAYFRRWSKEGFIEVGRSLHARYGATLVVFGEPKDQDVCAEIAQAIGAAAVDVSGHTTLGQFISFIARCDLVIANDGGPIHIAASQDIPTVSIFGPVDPVVYGPYPPSPRHRIVYQAQLRCRPCYHQFKLPPCPYERACLSCVEPSEVLQACEDVFEQSPLRGSGAI
ncbi:MAG: glycosyltransferase family 9 protein [Candidatus Omnitrophica bacterium]|nr:glycosyltransferase family 9 protein [Candidatus Omnitrophota bacterium]